MPTKPANDNKGKPATIRRATQKTATVKIQGKRIRLVSKNGTTTATDAPPLEWEMQAAQCRALKAHPDYGKRFLFAGGLEGVKTSKRTATISKTTGMTAGHPDLTLFIFGGYAAFVENKTMVGRLSTEQKERHALLTAMGFAVQVIRANSCDDAVAQILTFVNERLGYSASAGLGGVGVPEAA